MRLRPTALCLLLSLVLPFTRADTVSYSGRLSGDPSGGADGLLVATGIWGETESAGYTPAEFAWTVSRDGSGPWHYEYELRVYGAEVSHWLLETSETLTLADVRDPNGDYASSHGLLIAEHHGDGTATQPNPYMPATLFGLKMELESGQGTQYGTDSYEYALDFNSWREPIWTDFYAKDGAAGGTWNTVYNKGFTTTDTDPALTLAPTDGSYDHHVLAPDSNNSNGLPEPASLLLMLGGAACLAGRRIRRRTREGRT